MADNKIWQLWQNMWNREELSWTVFCVFSFCVYYYCLFYVYYPICFNMIRSETWISSDWLYKTIHPSPPPPLHPQNPFRSFSSPCFPLSLSLVYLLIQTKIPRFQVLGITHILKWHYNYLNSKYKCASQPPISTWTASKLQINEHDPTNAATRKTWK